MDDQIARKGTIKVQINPPDVTMTIANHLSGDHIAMTKVLTRIVEVGTEPCQKMKRFNSIVLSAMLDHLELKTNLGDRLLGKLCPQGGGVAGIGANRFYSSPTK